MIYDSFRALACGSDAYEIKGTMYPSGVEKVAPFKILLNGGEQIAYARIDGSFVFRDVAPGRYVIDIPSEVYLFSQVLCLLTGYPLHRAALTYWST